MGSVAIDQLDPFHFYFQTILLHRQVVIHPTSIHLLLIQAGFDKLERRVYMVHIGGFVH